MGTKHFSAVNLHKSVVLQGNNTELIKIMLILKWDFFQCIFLIYFCPFPCGCANNKRQVENIIMFIISKRKLIQ